MTPAEEALELLRRDINARIDQVAAQLRQEAPTDVLGSRLRFTVTEVGEYLGISERAVRSRIADGRIKSVKDGGRLLVTRRELERLAGFEPSSGLYAV